MRDGIEKGGFQAITFFCPLLGSFQFHPAIAQGTEHAIDIVGQITQFVIALYCQGDIASGIIGYMLYILLYIDQAV